MSEELMPNAENVDVMKEPSYDDIAKGIIKQSIRSAICIDDTYLAPYEENTTENVNLNSEEPKNLYYSFRRNGKCDLDIYRFKGSEEWQKHKYLTHNKDLMVVDWELDQQASPKYTDTLVILEEVISSQIIPFVVIYTNTSDLGGVSKTLLENFNYYASSDYTALIEKLTEKFKNLSNNADEIESFIEENLGFFHDFARVPSKRSDLSKELIEKLDTFLEMDEKHKEKCPKKFLSSIKELFEVSSLEDAILVVSNIVLSSDNANEKKYKNIRVNIDSLCYSINGVIVFVLHKDGLEDGVSPEELFQTFSEALSNNPHSIINLIALEIKDKFREDFAVIGTQFNTINESAFLYHALNYYNEKSTPKLNLDPFKNFVIMSWVHELMQHNLSTDMQSFQLMESIVGKSKDIQENPNLHKALAIYAAMISNIVLKNRTNLKLGFGDLFKSGEEYFLCITPHCDCFLPKKINHEFYFTRGEKVKKVDTALKDAEQGYYSFFFENDLPIVVKWECKPFTTYVSEEMNKSDGKKLSYSGKEYQLEYICSMKENYSQRIANNSFGYGHRVGVDLPHLHEKKL